MKEDFSTLEQIQRVAIDLALQYGPRVMVAILIMLAGNYAGRWVGNVVNLSLKKFHLEPPVAQLLVRVVRVMVLALFAIMALQNLGIELLPLIAGLGVAGAGVALAMQGVLSNIVAGLTIIFTKPFRVGEYISIVGEEGSVDNISLFTTVLSHADQSQVVIPNRKIVGEILHNYGKIRQLDMVLAVGNSTQLDQAIATANTLLAASQYVLQTPKPVVAVSILNPGSVGIAVKPWVNVTDYGAAQAELSQALIKSFRQLGMIGSTPQYEVKLIERA